MGLYFWCPSGDERTGYGKVHKRLKRALWRVGALLCERAGPGDVEVYYGIPLGDWLHRRLWRGRRTWPLVHYTMFEADPPPDEWIASVNGETGFDSAALVLVPSGWCAEVWRRAGVKCPVGVVPHGVDADEYPMLERDPGRAWTFLWQGAGYDDRKNRSLAERAFRELDLPGAWLVEKWTPLPGGYFSRVDPKSRIEWIGKPLKHAEMLRLFARCDCSVNPTSGEGFGLIPLEHAATGMVPIVTGWSGPMEYIEDIGGYPVRYLLGPSLHARGWQSGGSVDAKPDLDHLKETMLWTYEHREEATRDGRNAAEVIRERWTWEAAATRLVYELVEAGLAPVESLLGPARVDDARLCESVCQ
jgi:glycosyltransferase involved in cell wall biosynthesis